MIEVKGLKKEFDGLKVLNGIDYTINQGEKIVVIGPSGSGKSTFLRCLNLLEEPTGGEIWFDGTNITDPQNDINKMRQKMGMVFQHFNLFPHMTVLDNITFAPVRLKMQTKAEAKENALRLLRRIGLEDKAGEYPNKLSGGQKQRIAIVRALAMNPEVMLFDERTSQDSCEVPSDFHPRFQKTTKTYEYRILNRRFPDPTRRLNSFFYYYPLDVVKMQEASLYLVGEHDFKSFCTEKPEVTNTVRTIYSLNVIKEGDMIIIRVTGNGFLYNMVRIIAGTLIRVGGGFIEPQQIKKILEAKDRTLAGETARPEGLTLIGIRYGGNIQGERM